MATIRLPAYLKWRATPCGTGRPRWEPGPQLRAAGFKGEDLKDDAGHWLGLAAAIQRAEALNGDVAAFRASGHRQRKPKPATPLHCGAELWRLYEASPRFEKLAPDTRKDYRAKGRLFLAEYGGVAVAAIEHADLYGWWETLYRERGHTMANGTLAVARLLLSYAVKKGWRRDNPGKALGLETVAPRCVVFTPSEIAALETAAAALGMDDVGDAVVIALHTGQRQADVLGLAVDRAADGWCAFRQAKTGARVRVPHTDQLAERLAAIRRRRSSGAVVELGELTGVLIRDPDGQDYTRSSGRYAFWKRWNAVRALAATLLEQDAARTRRNEPVEIASKKFLDLRDTAVTRLALADCTVTQIRAITGHSLETIHQVLKHYLALDDSMAMAAIVKLKTWMTEEGIAL